MLNGTEGKIINVVAVNRSRKRRKLPKLTGLIKLAEQQQAARLAYLSDKNNAVKQSPDFDADDAKRQAELNAKREAELEGKKAAEEKAKREAAEKAKLEAAEKAKKEAEDKAKREAEEKAKKEAEEKAKLEAAEKAKKEAEEKAKLEAEEKAKKEAEEKAKLEAEEKAKKEAEEKAKLEAEEQAKKEAEEKAKLEAAEKAKKEAAQKAEEVEAPQEKAVKQAQPAVAVKKTVEKVAPKAEENPLMKKMATRRARKLIYSPKEALFEGTCTIDVGKEKNDAGEKIKDIIDNKIAEGLKLGYLDKYDGLKMAELKEEYENDTVYELADQEFKKMGIMLDGDKVKVYLFDWTGAGFTHIGYLPSDEAEKVRPYLEKIDDYSFDLCGIITGGKSKTITKDEQTGKVTVSKGKDGDYGIDLDITVILRKD